MGRDRHIKGKGKARDTTALDMDGLRHQRAKPTGKPGRKKGAGE